MRTALCRCWWPGLVVALLLTASCAARAPVSAPPAARRPSAPSRLSPANAFFEIQDLGLKVLWRQELGQRTDAPLKGIHAAGPFVVVEAGEGEVHCLDAASGTWKATKILRGGLLRPPTAMGQSLLLVASGGLYLLDTTAGDLSAIYRPNVPLFTPPLVYGNSLILCGGEGNVEQLSLEDGSERLLLSTEGTIVEQPVISDERLFAVGQWDRLVAVDLGSGATLWEWRPARPSRLSSGAAVYRSQVFVGDDRGFLYSLMADSGVVTWHRMFAAPIVSSPRVVGSQLLVFTDRPSVFSLNLAGHVEKLWEHEGGRRLIAVGKGVVYILDEDNSIVAIELGSGKQLWREQLPPDCVVAGEGQEPVFYIADSAGSVIAVRELE